MVKTFRLDKFGYEIEVGKVACQADGAVWFKYGGTVILVTVVSEPSKEFPGFLPLTVEYREYFSAAGKIPGGYFKREGKPSDREVLIGRLIDRAIRPLFPESFFDQVQVLATVYSVDKEHAPDTVALLATSAALTISTIPFMGPVGVVEMGRVNGKWIVNPTYPQSVESDARIVVAGTEEGIVMVEGSANELPENTFVDVLFDAHKEIKTIVSWQHELQKKIGKQKSAVEDVYSWDMWVQRAEEYLTDDRVQSVYVEDKITRNENIKAIKDSFTEQYKEDVEAHEIPEKVIGYIIESVLKQRLTELVFTLNKRIDQRASDQIRQISVEVGLLPCAHGSGLFTRGRTQALASITLGGGEDVQRLENIMEDDAERSFMLHYNFPPFSSGEVRPIRGTSRREVGHGHLAASAFQYLLPDKESFPYTIRIVTDILESDGSTSMATACSSTMGLMQAGVPIKKMVAGIAMGLLKSNKNDNFMVLSDIAAVEDAFGLMDFKVVGTDAGITAIQMDIKYKGGLPRKIFDVALEQARKGRLHILSEMGKVMDKPNPELSDLVPKVTTLRINVDKIGAIIGSGGKTIREITSTTDTNIDLEPDGLVKIFGGPGADTQRAVNWVKTLAGQIERSTLYTGPIRRIADFGLFVELVPGMDGLVHVSNIPRDQQRDFGKHFKVGQEVTVEVLEYDEVTGRVSLRLKK